MQIVLFFEEIALQIKLNFVCFTNLY